MIYIMDAIWSRSKSPIHVNQITFRLLFPIAFILQNQLNYSQYNGKKYEQFN